MSSAPEHDEVEREIHALRQKVADLQRRLARFADDADTRPAGELEVTLSEREELLSEAERLAHLGSWIWNLETNQVFWSDEMFRIHGYDPARDRASVEAFWAAVHPDDLPHLQEESRRGAELGETHLEEYRVLRQDGTVRLCRLDAAMLYDAEGRPRRMVGAVLDVTEAREAARRVTGLQERLAQAEKTEAIGRLAGGVAHDFNNLLMVMQGNLDRLRIVDSGELDSMQQALRSARALTERLLAFGRRATLRRRVLDLNGLVAASLALFGGAVGDEITLSTRLAPDPSWVDVDEALIEQAIINLVLNARDALEGRGTIEVGTRVEGEVVALWVRDAGLGMDEERRQRVFEPFFTTKSDERGIGLGMAMVQGAVEQHGGTIEVASAPGQGTTFTLRLAAAPAPATTGDDVAPAAAVPASHTILVVEDQPMVARAVAGLLLDHGHQVVLAHCADEARAAIAAGDPSIDLVLCDVVMPGMGGPDLVRELRRGPGRVPKVIFMSGYVDVPNLPEGCELLPKPFSASELTAAVARALG